MTINGNHTFEIDTVMKKWKDDFENLYNKPNNDDYDHYFYENVLKQKHILEQSPYFDFNISDDPLNKPIMYDEVEKVIKKLQKKKSVGWDNIPNKIIKNKFLTMLLLKFFQKCFDSGLVPSIWLKSVITPIPKPGMKDPYTPLNYRGISLISCLSKVYSSILNKRISAYCNRSNIIVDEQNGFRPGRSCEEHIFTLTTIIRNQFAKSKPLFTSFIDLKKAFDWVDRDLLMYKLLTYGINGKIYNAIKSLYQHSMSSVRLNEYMSEWFPVTSGVKQGDNLSPILFCLYINDLALTLKENNIGVNIDGHTICILLYADDIVLLAENEKDLQTLLDITQDWCYKWKMNINVEKSKIMHFRQNKKKQSNVNFSFGDMPLQYCESYKYLGIYLDPHLKFNCCIKTLADSGGEHWVHCCQNSNTLKM